MKPLYLAVLGLCLGIRLLAQTPNDATVQLRTPEELDKLLSPIALYPDALVALILPAACEPSDIVLAARLVAVNASEGQIDAQPWEESVKSLTHYPTVLNWMDANLEWTRDVGEAFLAQPADVMNAIQRLRSEARASGMLFDTPQQRVLVEDDVIYLYPADDNIIYVPSYDPEILILHRPWHGPFLSFGIGFSFGSWLRYDCDWHRRAVWVHDRDQSRDFRHDWRRPDNPFHNRIIGSSWRPDPGHRYSRNPSHRDFNFNRPSYSYGPDSNRRPDDRRRDGDRNREIKPRDRGPNPSQRRDPSPGLSVNRPHPSPIVGPQPIGPRGNNAGAEHTNRPNPPKFGDRHAQPNTAPSPAPRIAAPQGRQESANSPAERRSQPERPRIDAPKPRSEAPRETPRRTDDNRSDHKSRPDRDD